jgi:hypothetical protein
MTKIDKVKRHNMPSYDKPCHKLVSLAFAFVTSFSAAHPLEDAAEKATARCVQFEDAESVEHCGTGMGGRSPERTAARMAVMNVFVERTAFMRECQAKQSFEDCAHQAEWLIGSGMSRVLLGPVRYTDATPSPLPRSDKRR